MPSNPFKRELTSDRLAINRLRSRVRNLERSYPRPGAWQYATPTAPAAPADESDSTDGVAFQNGWANIALPDGSYSPLRYRINHAGRVEIVGAIDGGTLNSVCITLPSLYRPLEDVLATVASTDGGRVMTIQISASTGDVTVIGTPVATAIVGDGSITTGDLADGAVTTAKLANGAVTTAKIADGAVTGAKLEDDGVTAGTYGDATHYPVITVDAKGRVTAASEDAITGGGSSYPTVNVKDHGAVGDVATVGTGGTDDTAAFIAAIAALPTVNGHAAGTILVPAGVYRINGDIGNIGPYVSILGEGKWASILDYRGTGDCIRVADLTAPAAPGWLNGKTAGTLRDFSIDGTSAGASAIGLHYGDINGGEIDILVQNFTGATAQAILFENTVWWMERVRCKAILRNNTFAVTYQIAAGGSSTATGSFGHGDYDFQIYGLADQRAVRVLAGAHVYDGRLRIDGATTKGTLSALGVLAVSGTGPAGTAGAGGYSVVYNMHLDITVEHQADVAHGGVTLQQTIHLGDTTNNLIQDCYGQLSFTGYDVSNVDLSTGAFRFTGVITGDATLGKAAYTKLFDKTLSADAATIDTGAIIPAGFSAIMVVIYGRMSDAANAVNIGLRFNGDSGANYGHVWTRNNGTTLSGGSGAGDTSAVIGALPGASAAANIFGTARAVISSYDQTTNAKSVEAHTVAVDTTSTNSFETSGGCYWKPAVQAAITRITAIDVPGNNFKAGSRMIVYGLP